jgi:hypothetical protein
MPDVLGIEKAQIISIAGLYMSVPFKKVFKYLNGIGISVILMC